MSFYKVDGDPTMPYSVQAGGVKLIKSKHVPKLGSGFWIGVDLDGTLAEYTTFQGATHIGKPIEPMVEVVKTLLADGMDVRIFTARVDGGHVAKSMGLAAADEFADVALVRTAIAQWCINNIGKVLPITNVKDFGMVILYDDRTVGVEMNTGKLHTTLAWQQGFKMNSIS